MKSRPKTRFTATDSLSKVIVVGLVSISAMSANFQAQAAESVAIITPEGPFPFVHLPLPVCRNAGGARGSISRKPAYAPVRGIAEGAGERSLSSAYHSSIQNPHSMIRRG